jgi:hypothetical protein
LPGNQPQEPTPIWYEIPPYVGAGGIDELIVGAVLAIIVGGFAGAVLTMIGVLLGIVKS